MVIALVIAAGMNLFSYWRSDKMVLGMYGAEEVDAHSGGEYYRIVADLAARAELPMPRVYVMNNPQPNAFATGRNPEHAAVCASTGLLEMLSPAGGVGRAGARAGARQELRHADHGGGGHHRRRHLHAGAVSPVRRPVRRPPREQQRHRLDRRAGRHDRRPARRHAGADGDQPLARVPGRPPGRHDLRPAAVARLGAAARSRATRTRSATSRPRRRPPPRTSSSSTR